jgi:hypothetical protein
VRDKKWLDKKFAEEGKPEGLLNFQEKISNFQDYPNLAQALTIVMHYLLVFPKNLTLDAFEQQFGITYSDIAVLYAKGLNNCIENTEKDMKKYSKIIIENKKLKRQNRKLQHQLALEKITGIMRRTKESLVN